MQFTVYKNKLRISKQVIHAARELSRVWIIQPVRFVRDLVIVDVDSRIEMNRRDLLR